MALKQISSRISTASRPFSQKQFWIDLYNEIDQDQVFNGAAALSFYFLLAIFPALIFMLAVLPYLPLENMTSEIMTFIGQVLPDSAAKALETTVISVTTTKKQSLLSFGAAFTLWSASSGLYAIMQELNTSYDVRETRSFVRVRGLSLLLTLVFGVAILGSFALIVTGGALQTYLERTYVVSPLVPVLFLIFRWAVILALLFGGFSVLYYYGTNVSQKFRFITPGAVVGVFGLILVSFGFRIYVSHFSDYSSSYGTIGAVVVLMLWFYLAGAVILIGSEINALIEMSPMKKASVLANREFMLSQPPENPSPSERKEAVPPGVKEGTRGARAGAHP